MQLFAYELRRVWNWKSQMISKYVYTGNNPEYLALDDRKAVGCSFNQWLRHNTPGFSCHLDANILICRSRNHVLYVKCLLAAYWSITQSVTNLCMMYKLVTFIFCSSSWRSFFLFFLILSVLIKKKQTKKTKTQHQNTHKKISCPYPWQFLMRYLINKNQWHSQSQK